MGDSLSSSASVRPPRLSDEEFAAVRALRGRYAYGSDRAYAYGKVGALALTPVAAGYELAKGLALAENPFLSATGQAALRVGGPLGAAVWDGELPDVKEVLRKALVPGEPGAYPYEVDASTSPASLDNVRNYVRGVLRREPIDSPVAQARAIER